MNTWTHLDRSGMGNAFLADGEPDVAQWIDDYTGYRCMVNRCDRSGHLCGYVGVPEGHRLWGIEYTRQISVSSDWMEGRELDDRTSPIDLLCMGLDGADKPSLSIFFEVHGGLTYSRATGGAEHLERVKLNRPEQLEDYVTNPQEWMCFLDERGETLSTWFWGFDCHHSGDGDLSNDRLFFGGPYRDFKYVTSEVTNLAAQVKRLDEMVKEDPSVLLPSDEGKPTE